MHCTTVYDSTDGDGSCYHVHLQVLLCIDSATAKVGMEEIMDLDQLIKLLQDIRDSKGGDLPVYVDLDSETFPVVTGTFQERVDDTTLGVTTIVPAQVLLELGGGFYE